MTRKKIRDHFKSLQTGIDDEVGEIDDFLTPIKKEREEKILVARAEKDRTKEFE